MPYMLLHSMFAASGWKEEKGQEEGMPGRNTEVHNMEENAEK